LQPEGHETRSKNATVPGGMDVPPPPPPPPTGSQLSPSPNSINFPTALYLCVPSVFVSQTVSLPILTPPATCSLVTGEAVPAPTLPPLTTSSTDPTSRPPAGRRSAPVIVSPVIA